MQKSLPLFYWADQKNFGDELSASVVEWIAKTPVREQRKSRCARLFAVGSILEHARDGDVVWGSGIHPAHYDQYWRPATYGWKRRLLFRTAPYDLAILGVRGPLTRDALLFRGNQCPEVFGDPAVLLPLIYPKARASERKLGVIPHYADRHWFDERNIDYIDVARPWREVVDEIVRCDAVIASSLHGIIVAEAYGVPAVWLRMHGSEGIMKYLDYYLGTERAPKPVHSFADAQVATPTIPPDFRNMRKQLIDAFDRRIIERLIA